MNRTYQIVGPTAPTNNCRSRYDMEVYTKEAKQRELSPEHSSAAKRSGRERSTRSESSGTTDMLDERLFFRYIL